MSKNTQIPPLNVSKKLFIIKISLKRIIYSFLCCCLIFSLQTSLHASRFSLKKPPAHYACFKSPYYQKHSQSTLVHKRQNPIYSPEVICLAWQKRSNNHAKYRHAHGYYMWGAIGTAGFLLATMQQKTATAKGARGTRGYRPYDCRWGEEFEEQADQALQDAKDFKKAYYRGDFNGRNDVKQSLGGSALMRLLFAQDQADYLVSKHYIDYSCWAFRSLSCDYYNKNCKLRNYYYEDLQNNINEIRKILRVPQAAGWEDQVASFLQGGVHSYVLMEVGAGAVELVNAIPLVGEVIIFSATTGFLAYTVVNVAYTVGNGVAKHFFADKSLLEEEEIQIQQELYVRAFCAHKHSIEQAQEWGGFTVMVGMGIKSMATLLESRAAKIAAQKAEIELARKMEREAAKKAEAALAKKAEATLAKKAEAALAKKAEAELAKKMEREAAKKLEREAAKKLEREAAKKLEREAAKKAAGSVQKMSKKSFIEFIGKLDPDPKLASQAMNTRYGTTQFKPFTAKNYRHNLQVKSNLKGVKGGVASNIHAHHIIPQQFETKCRELGINIHDPNFLTWLKKEVHQKVHNGKAYNARWEKIFNKPSLSKEGVLEELWTIIQEYGFELPGFA